MESDLVKMSVWSAFVLLDDGTWEQPSFKAPKHATEEQISLALLSSVGRRSFAVYGIAPDPDAPEESVRTDIWK